MQSQSAKRQYQSGHGRKLYCDCRWDFSFLHFGESLIAFGDVDFIVERNGRFLYVETKGGNETLPAGQRILLEQLSRKPDFCVCVLRGRKGPPTVPETVEFAIKGKLTKPYPINRSRLQEFITAWYEAANSGAKQIKFKIGDPIDGPDDY